ncbi:hypothetical protein GCM10009118_13360 [Wandonia haliotis]|uniref:Uncharacterized protein n=2 Tax=Wandonia haliotis TaxID=574963 RepID=A0ABP3Y2Q4_9FLAO
MLCGASSCKKENTEPNSSNPNVLPPLTHEGKNTFGCKVNGEVWVAQMPFAVGGAIALEGTYYTNTNMMYLVAKRKLEEEGKFDRIDILVENLIQNGDYVMLTDDNQMRGFTDYEGNYNCSTYRYNDDLLRRVIITYFSPSQGIISGTFEMDLINPSCPGDTIRIREGRFDWRMTVY